MTSTVIDSTMLEGVASQPVLDELLQLIRRKSRSPKRPRGGAQ